MLCQCLNDWLKVADLHRVRFWHVLESHQMSLIEEFLQVATNVKIVCSSMQYWSLLCASQGHIVLSLFQLFYLFLDLMPKYYINIICKYLTTFIMLHSLGLYSTNFKRQLSRWQIFMFYSSKTFSYNICENWLTLKPGKRSASMEVFRLKYPYKTHLIWPCFLVLCPLSLPQYLHIFIKSLEKYNLSQDFTLVLTFINLL